MIVAFAVAITFSSSTEIPSNGNLSRPVQHQKKQDKKNYRKSNSGEQIIDKVEEKTPGKRENKRDSETQNN